MVTRIPRVPSFTSQSPAFGTFLRRSLISHRSSVFFLLNSIIPVLFRKGQSISCMTDDLTRYRISTSQLNRTLVKQNILKAKNARPVVKSQEFDEQREKKEHQTNKTFLGNISSDCHYYRLRVTTKKYETNTTPK